MNEKQQTYVIARDGRLTSVYDEALTDSLYSEGAVTIRRASRVEPTEAGAWTADLSPVNGPLIGTFTRRSEALAAELAWLNENLTTIN